MWAGVSVGDCMRGGRGETPGNAVTLQGGNLCILHGLEINRVQLRSEGFTESIQKEYWDAAPPDCTCQHRHVGTERVFSRTGRAAEITPHQLAAGYQHTDTPPSDPLHCIKGEASSELVVLPP